MCHADNDESCVAALILTIIIVSVQQTNCSKILDSYTQLWKLRFTSSVKILGVTFTNHLSVSQHVHSVTRSCSQHLYALKLLRAHRMCEEALQQVFRAVIISKICHASSAWWGFTSATDRQHLKAFLRRSVRSRLCPPELSDLTELVEAADDKLFRLILKDNHILSSLLPPKSESRYNFSRLGLVYLGLGKQTTSPPAATDQLQSADYRTVKYLSTTNQIKSNLLAENQSTK